MLIPWTASFYRLEAKWHAHSDLVRSKVSSPPSTSQPQRREPQVSFPVQMTKACLFSLPKRRGGCYRDS